MLVPSLNTQRQPSEPPQRPIAGFWGLFLAQLAPRVQVDALTLAGWLRANSPNKTTANIKNRETKTLTFMFVSSAGLFARLRQNRQF